jgi:hypothetical protein
MLRFLLHGQRKVRVVGGRSAQGARAESSDYGLSPSGRSVHRAKCHRVVAAILASGIIRINRKSAVLP